jgi:putative oxidoreductase
MVTRMSIANALTAYEPHLRSLLRVVVGFTFSLHGYQKFFGMFGGLGGFEPPLTSALGIAGILETFGGGLILLGLATRPVAFILSGQMAVAYFRAHNPQGPWPLLNMGELAVLYCFIFLWMTAAGAGPWSVDRAIGWKT